MLDELIKNCDVLVENFAPGALDRMGLTWEHIHKLNPRMIVASVKGFGPGPYEDCKVYENVAQCAGGSASTTGFRDGPPLVTGAQIGDSAAPGCISRSASSRRSTSASAPAAARRCSRAMQDGVLNLCARQAARPAAPRSTARSPNTASTARACRSAKRRRAPATIPAAASPAGSSSARAGRTIPTPTSISSPRRRCGSAICDLIGKPDWKTDPDYATPHGAAAASSRQIFATHRGMDHDQDQVRGHGNLQRASTSRSARSCR